ncbi:probable splicing factor, arginine/serine-rich 4 [Sycon ciliatum]|uniref:probable splicing factor, arginine/serine-rich 4 n=1 Tax=Sycon ciliatum TaxID=27933 RepID=UPI0031F66AD3
MVDSFRSNTGHPDIGGMYSLRVDNISFRTNADDLLAVFGRYGMVGDIYVPRFLQPGTPVGFAFVRYYSRRSALEALFRADRNLVLAGRQLRVDRARYGWPEPEQPHRPRSFDYASHCSGATGGGSRRSPSPCRQRHHGRSRSNGRQKPRKSPSPCRQRDHGRSRINSREEPRPRRRQARSGSSSHAPHAPHAGDGRGGSARVVVVCRDRDAAPHTAHRMPHVKCTFARVHARRRDLPALHYSPQRSPCGARQRSYSRSRSQLRLA